MTTITAPALGRLQPVGAARTPPPGSDIQVDALRRVLTSRPDIATSFDVFDTLLWRAVPKPTDVFLLLGERLRELGLLRSSASPELFAKLRILAEQVARAQAQAERQTSEVRLDDIYGFAGWNRQTSASAGELTRQELLIESRVTTADPWLSDLLCELATLDEPPTIFLVSDTYFDTESLRFLLAAAGLQTLSDVPVFTSCEHGVSKSGGLLGLAAQHMAVDLTRYIHVGNSAESDIAPATVLGAPSVHLPETSPLALRALRTEGWLPRTDASELLHRESGDSGLTALRGRVTRRRPPSVEPEDAIFWDIGAVTLGPVFAGFAEWVHERAAALGIDSALCLMREGRFLAQLLDAVPAERRVCTAVPFWASREACVRATFFSADEAELQRVQWRIDTPSPSAILETVGLRPEDVPGGLDTLDAVARSGEPEHVADAFIDFLASRADIRDQIVERSRLRRKAFVAYLQSSLAGRSRTVGLVDLGFGATIQELLSQMVAAECVDIDFRGLYLFTSTRALIRQLGGHVAEGFLADAGSSSVHLAALDRSPEILEVVATSSDGSLLDVTADGKPVLGPPLTGASQQRRRVLVQEGVRHFQREWNYFEASNSLRGRKPLSSCGPALQHILYGFITRPGPDVARAFADWEHDANFGSARLTSLVPENIRRSADHLAPEHFALAKASDLCWVGAAATYAGAEHEVAWLQEGRVPVGQFIDGQSTGTLHLLIDAGEGAERAGSEAPLLFSRAGRGVIAWSGQTEASRFALRVSGAHTAVVIRIDELTLTRLDGSTESLQWRVGASGTPEGVSLTADSAVRDGVAVLDEKSTLSIALDAPARQVEVRYATLLV